MNKITAFFRHLYQAYCKEFRMVTHDQGIMLFMLFLPLAYPVIYSLIYNPELVKEVDVVVIDSDATPKSRKLTRMLDAADQIHVLGYAANLDEAREAVNSHKAYGIIQIPEGFERKIGRGEVSPAVFYSDMSLLLRYRGFMVAATNVMQEIGGEIRMENINRVVPLATTVVTGDLMPVNSISMGNMRSGFDSFIMPGVLILILQQCILLAAGMGGGAKHEHPELLGYNPNSQKAPATFTVMLGQIFCWSTILAIPILFLIHYVPLIFRFPMQGDLLEEVALMVPVVLGACGMGLTYQAVVAEREQVFVTWVFSSVVFLLLSGLIWPRYDMPEIWRAVSAVCPATWGVEGFVKMNSNGASLSQIKDIYYHSWIVAGGWLVAGWMVQQWVLRRRLRKYFKPC
ncbi:MAG: ABC transporter permease [Muribaculaceae bacterium]|nr:ABC transporter permease [Muribaculaceae bacterium]